MQCTFPKSISCLSSATIRTFLNNIPNAKSQWRNDWSITCLNFTPCVYPLSCNNGKEWSLNPFLNPKPQTWNEKKKSETCHKAFLCPIYQSLVIRSTWCLNFIPHPKPQTQNNEGVWMPSRTLNLRYKKTGASQDTRPSCALILCLLSTQSESSWMPSRTLILC